MESAELATGPLETEELGSIHPSALKLVNTESSRQVVSNIIFAWDVIPLVRVCSTLYLTHSEGHERFKATGRVSDPGQGDSAICEELDIYKL